MRFDEDGPWDLEIEGFEVTHISDDFYPIDIVATGSEEASAMVRLEGPFELHAPDGTVQMVDLDESTPALLSVLRNDVIRLPRVTKDSELRVEFASGHVITSSATPNYENWEIHAPGKFSEVLVVALPGGGEPAIWDGETPPRRFRVVDG